jgi:hypothetical protein
MVSLIHQLENNEAILLMYLAGELSAEDRADVEQMLATDGSMRAELERLRALQDGTFAALGGLESHSRLPVAESVAVRRAMRTMHQWQIDHAQAPPPEEAVAELRFPWWSYPLTTAAAVMIAFLVWWGNRPEPVDRRTTAYQSETPNGPGDLKGIQDELAGDILIDSLDISDEDIVTLAINQPVDAGIARLQALARRPNDIDAIYLNGGEEKW